MLSKGCRLAQSRSPSPLLPLAAPAHEKHRWSDSVKLSPSWEVNSSSDNHKLLILWKLKVHYRVHKSPPLVPVLSEIRKDQSKSKGLKSFVTCSLPRLGVAGASSNPQPGGKPLVGCPRILIQYIRPTLHILKTAPPCATWKRAKSRWRGHIYHGLCCSDMETLNYKGDCAYANGLPVLAQGLGVIILMTLAINGSRFPKLLKGFQQNQVQQLTEIKSSFSWVDLSF